MCFLCCLKRIILDKERGRGRAYGSVSGKVRLVIGYRMNIAVGQNVTWARYVMYSIINVNYVFDLTHLLLHNL